jgi:hypothetical protein
VDCRGLSRPPSPNRICTRESGLMKFALWGIRV